MASATANSLLIHATRVRRVMAGPPRIPEWHEFTGSMVGGPSALVKPVVPLFRLLWLPHGEGRAGRVRDHAHPSERAHLGHVHDDLGTQLLRLPCRRADVVDQD